MAVAINVIIKSITYHSNTTETSRRKKTNITIEIVLLVSAAAVCRVHTVLLCAFKYGLLSSAAYYVDMLGKAILLSLLGIVSSPLWV